LPSGAHFLNVIESVFSGVARAIIHNSNYKTLDDAKTAINRYFEKRNAHFRQYPRRAGNKIWGKERESRRFLRSKQLQGSTLSLTERLIGLTDRGQRERRFLPLHD
jgi:hypothetical protein